MKGGGGFTNEFPDITGYFWNESNQKGQNVGQVDDLLELFREISGMLLGIPNVVGFSNYCNSSILFPFNKVQI